MLVAVFYAHHGQAQLCDYDQDRANQSWQSSCSLRDYCDGIQDKYGSQEISCSGNLNSIHSVTELFKDLVSDEYPMAFYDERHYHTYDGYQYVTNRYQFDLKSGSRRVLYLDENFDDDGDIPSSCEVSTSGHICRKCSICGGTVDPYSYSYTADCSNVADGLYLDCTESFGKLLNTLRLSYSIKPNSDKTKKRKGAGIAVGVLGGIFVFCGLLYCYRKSKTPEQPPVAGSLDASGTAVVKTSLGWWEGWQRDGHKQHTMLYVLLICLTLSGIIRSSSIGVIGFLWILFYIWFLCEYRHSSSRRYLQNINTAQTTLEYLEALRVAAPTISLHIECYHNKTRVISTTDSRGNTSFHTQIYSVVTYSETEVVPIVEWGNASTFPTSTEIQQYQLTKVKVSKTFDADAGYFSRENAFINRNRNRDAHYTFHVIYNIPGFTDQVLCYVDRAHKPVMLNSFCLLMSHLFVLPSLPYRIWMSAISGKIETTVHKWIRTEESTSVLRTALQEISSEGVDGNLHNGDDDDKSNENDNPLPSEPEAVLEEEKLDKEGDDGTESSPSQSSEGGTEDSATA